MRITKEGHIGLSNEKKAETTSEHFTIALSFLRKDRHTGYWVIHIYSKAYELNSPFMQRSNSNGRRWKKNFLERLGFDHFSACNILNGECYFKVLAEIPLGESGLGSIDRMFENQIIYDRFNKFATQVGGVYQKMRELDQMLTDIGFELPYDKLELSPVEHGKEERIYPSGCVYDFYRDFSGLIKEAKNEVIITDNYANEELIDLYLEKASAGVKIKVLTKQPKGNFITVAKKFKNKPNADFEVRKSMDWHDRWVFIDNDCWVSGQSVKDAGTKPTFLVKLGGYDLLKKLFDDVWNNASILV